MYVLTYSTDESGSTYVQFRITRVLPGNKSRFMQGIGVCPTRTKNLERYLLQVSRLPKSYLTFSPFEDLVSQELMVVVDIGLHLLLHSRPRDFFLFSFFLHQIMWVFGFDHLC